MQVLPFSVYAACRLLDTTPQDIGNGQVYEALRTMAGFYLRADLESLCECIQVCTQKPQGSPSGSGWMSLVQNAPFAPGAVELNGSQEKDKAITCSVVEPQRQALAIFHEAG